MPIFSLLKAQKEVDPLLRTKITIDSETGESPTQFFEAGTRRRLSDAEVRDLDWKECTFNVLLRISSMCVNSGAYGPVATPEAIVVKRLDEFPEFLDDEGLAANLWGASTSSVRSGRPPGAEREYRLHANYGG